MLHLYIDYVRTKQRLLGGSPCIDRKPCKIVGYWDRKVISCMEKTQINIKFDFSKLKRFTFYFPNEL